MLSIALTSSEQINQSFGEEPKDKKTKETKSDSKPKKEDKSEDKTKTKEEDKPKEDTKDKKDKPKDEIITKDDDNNKKDDPSTSNNDPSTTPSNAFPSTFYTGIAKRSVNALTNPKLKEWASLTRVVTTIS
jgi:hypothetical protein